ncbi:hypothetical protein EBU58_15395, partial [bacterium]|nr:hypothetical protein [bacterium]
MHNLYTDREQRIVFPVCAEAPARLVAGCARKREGNTCGGSRERHHAIGRRRVDEITHIDIGI